ncbi:odorant receptor 22b-like, partial [Aphis craccivora]
DIRQHFYIYYALVECCGISALFSTTKANNYKNNSKIDYFLMIFASTYVYLSIWKLFKCLKDRKNFLDLFKIGKLDFLTSKECSKYSKVQYKHRDKNLKFVNYFLIFSFVVILQWFIFPIVINEIINFENSENLKV